MANPYLKVSVSAFKAALSLIPTPLTSQSGNVAGYRLLSEGNSLTVMSYNLTASGSSYIQDVDATEFDIVIPSSLVKILTFGSKDLHLEIVGNQLINKNNKNKVALINTEDWVDDIEVRGSPIFLGSLVDSLKIAATFVCEDREILKKIKISSNSLVATNGHVACVLETPTEIVDSACLPATAIPYLSKQCEAIFGEAGNVKVTTADSDVIIFGSNAGDYPPVETIFPASFNFSAQIDTKKGLAILALIKSVDANSAVDIINQDNRLCVAFSNGVVDVLEDVGVDDLEEWETISFSTKYLSQALAGAEIKTIRQNTATTAAIFESEGTRVLAMPITKR